MKLSVIIPIFNEASTAGEVIRRVRAAGTAGLEIEIIAVDDGSTDGTATVLEGARGPDLTVLRHEANRGKGVAIRTALAAVTGDAVIIQDADLEYDPADYASILDPMACHGAQVVYGSRILGRGPHSYLRYYYGGRLLTLLFNILYRTVLTDLTTCYKAFRTEVITSIPLRCERFEFCPEVTARLVRRGIAITEVPVSYHPRSMPEGKKIRWHDGIQAAWTILAMRFRPVGSARGR